MTSERCPVCDREMCRIEDAKRVYLEAEAGKGNILEALHEFQLAGSDCAAHHVDWRARALESDATISRVRAEIEVMKVAASIGDESDDDECQIVAGAMQSCVENLLAAIEGRDACWHEAADPIVELTALADVMQMVADRLPILTACRMRVHAEEIAAEAIRLGAEKRNDPG